MFKVLLSLLISVVTLSVSAACYTYDNSSTQVNWTAYKTPAKAGVNGSFKDIKVSPKKSSGSLTDIMTGASFKIDTNSTHTKNPARDTKIEKFFFDGVQISGKVTKLGKDKIYTTMTMNGTSVSVPLKMSLSGNTLTATGHIDILDFMMSKHLSSINKACKALHEGKTWSDVKVTLKTSFKGC